MTRWDGPSGDELFFEEQAFRKARVWIPMLGLDALVLGLFGYGFYQQLYRGIPWGNRPLSDGALIGIGVAVVAVVLGLNALIAALRLRVWVEPDRLRIRYVPFVRKEIPLGDIASLEARTYRPIAEYGGWGIRWGGRKRGWAYNVSGKRGVAVELTNGKRLLLGSLRADELAEAIARARERS